MLLQLSFSSFPKDIQQALEVRGIRSVEHLAERLETRVYDDLLCYQLGVSPQMLDAWRRALLQEEPRRPLVWLQGVKLGVTLIRASVAIVLWLWFVAVLLIPSRTLFEIY